MRLYEIAAEYRRVDAMLDESGGELTPEIEAAMAALSGTLEAKADAIGGLIREALAESDAIEIEAQRMHAKAAAAEKRAARLKAFLLHNLEVAGKDRLKTPRFSFWRAKAGRPSIAWTEDGPPPEPFRRVRVELDGNRAYEHLKAGGVLPEGFAVSRSEYLGMR